MHKKTTQNLFFIFLLFFTANIAAQNAHEINLYITDTVIVKKKTKNSSQYAVKVNTEIDVRNLQDTLFLYSFNKYVFPSIFHSDLSPDGYKTSMGLIFIIEDKNNQIISPRSTHNSYAKEKDETRINNSRIFVSSKQKIKYKKLNDEERRNYDRAKHVISSEKQNLELYLIFYYTSGSFNTYHNLPKGEYYLYFAYSSYYVPPSSDKIDVNKIFRGNFVSNKVKLIVE